jgi:hypothetical protein
LAYNLVYISSLKYGIPLTSLSYKQITEIHRYAVDKFNSAMGIDHSTHRALVYGPTEYGGFGVRHLYTEMMGMKLETLISHIRAGSQLGLSFIININYIQLHAGIGTPILLSKDNISYIPMNWILHLRQFLIKINDLWIPKLQSQYDQFIMTAFVNMKATRAELVVLNNWRIYYRVLLFSELRFSLGQGIQPVYLEYNHDTLVRQSSMTLNWPIQDKPDEVSFKIWKRYIKLCFLKTDSNRITQLGAWNVTEVIKMSPRHGLFKQANRSIYSRGSRYIQ